jgi:uncharacterized protein YegP (UPF0339 family)
MCNEREVILSACNPPRLRERCSPKLCDLVLKHARNDMLAIFITNSNKSCPVTATFQYFEGDDGDCYWRLQDSNNETVADGAEGYASERNVENAIENVKDEVSAGSADFESYEGNDGDYYWRLRDSNGEIVADGAEGYASESNVEDAIENVKDEIPDASIEEV